MFILGKNIMNKLVTERAGNPVVKWEDRNNVNQKQWAIERLKFYVKLSNSNVSNIRKKWNRTLDHRLIASLAIASRYHVLPDYITKHCRLDQRKDLVVTQMVTTISDGNKDTVLKIIKDGIDSQELCQVKNPPRYRGLCFTAGYTMMKAFEKALEHECFCSVCKQSVGDSKDDLLAGSGWLIQRYLD